MTESQFTDSHILRVARSTPDGERDFAHVADSSSATCWVVDELGLSRLTMSIAKSSVGHRARSADASSYVRCGSVSYVVAKLIPLQHAVLLGMWHSHLPLERRDEIQISLGYFPPILEKILILYLSRATPRVRYIRGAWTWTASGTAVTVACARRWVGPIPTQDAVWFVQVAEAACWMFVAYGLMFPEALMGIWRVTERTWRARSPRRCWGRGSKCCLRRRVRRSHKF